MVAKVEFHCRELFARVGFIVTNLALDNRVVVRFYKELPEAARRWPDS